MALPLTGYGVRLIAAYYSSIDPDRMKGWLGLADVQRTVYQHSGYPSAVGRAQDRES